MSHPFEPNWKVHPGEILEEEMKERGLTTHDIAHMTGTPEPYIAGIVKGENKLHPAFALRLERCFGVSHQTWDNLQKNYDDQTARGVE